METPSIALEDAMIDDEREDRRHQRADEDHIGPDRQVAAGE
jgi:hypothetical protein